MRRHQLNHEALITCIIAVILLTIVFLSGYALFYCLSADKHRQKLMDDCVNDGHKEYECIAITQAPFLEKVNNAGGTKH